MNGDFAPFLSDLAQTDPGLGVIRMSALLAEEQGELEEDEIALLFGQAAGGALETLDAAEIWPELTRGLMAPYPSRMIRALRACGALSQTLPEVAALFGVPQIADGAASVDLGEHMLSALDEAARRGAPLDVRFSLLAMNVGKADSPPEHLPVHYRHIERGGPRIEAMCERFAAPANCKSLALLALAECERVHRASKVRAGPIAQMLQRLGAFDPDGLFQKLMTVCAADYCAYGERSGQDYPKSVLLAAALRACADVDEAGFAGLGAAEAADALQSARAAAIAKAFHSQRWSGETA